METVASAGQKNFTINYTDNQPKLFAVRCPKNGQSDFMGNIVKFGIK